MLRGLEQRCLPPSPAITWRASVGKLLSGGVLCVSVRCVSRVSRVVPSFVLWRVLRGWPCSPVVRVWSCRAVGVSVAGVSSVVSGPVRCSRVCRRGRGRVAWGCAVAGKPAVVTFGGSRSLASCPLAVAAVRSVLASGRRVSVGCAVGVDSVVVSSVLAAGGASSLSVFAVGGFGAGGRPLGFWRGSAVSAVSAAVRAGASVSWWAGGPSSLPLRVRLFGRSVAACSLALGGGPGSGAVFFVAGGPSVSPGTWSVAAWCVRAGLPVVVFPAGSSGFAWPGASWAGVAGSFAPAAASGLWSLARRWVPAGVPSSAVVASWRLGSPG